MANQEQRTDDGIASRVAAAIAEKPVTVHALVSIADALDVPVESLLIGDPE